jgi:hypothetical protein
MTTFASIIHLRGKKKKKKKRERKILIARLHCQLPGTFSSEEKTTSYSRQQDDITNVKSLAPGNWLKISRRTVSIVRLRRRLKPQI